DDKRAELRHPIALRVRLRYTGVEQFISKFATNLSRGGMFLATRSPRPVGTLLEFQLVLADGSPIVEGTGEVRWTAPYDRATPESRHGMGIAFVELSEESAAVVERALAERRARGDQDLDSIPGAPASPREAAVPVTPEEAVASTPAGERRRAPRVTELLADATSDQVCPAGQRVADAVRRARVLAGDLAQDPDDDVLAGLLEYDGAPQSVTVDEASRELAARFGGVPIESQPRTADARVADLARAGHTGSPEPRPVPQTPDHGAPAIAH